MSIHSKIIEDLSNYENKDELMNYLCELEKKYVNTSLVRIFETIIKNVNNLYHNEGSSPWSDFKYDMILEILQEKYNFNNNIIGSNIKSNDSIDLPYFMASMNKYKSEGEISNWKKKYFPPYNISAKLDGISALYSNNNLYTRGNGYKGRLINYLIPYLNLPKNLDFTIRGELIIKKSLFNEKYSDKYANARNLVCGAMNRVYSEENKDLYSDIDFVIYDIYYKNPLQYHNKISILEKYNSLNIVCYKDKLSFLNKEMCDNVLTEFKNNYDYEIDGIIINNNKPCIHPVGSNPEFAFAYKNNFINVEMKEGIVDNIIWNVSKDGYIKPKIKLLKAIKCDSSSIMFVTGFNAKYILENKIKKNRKLMIGLSGGVIPHIFKVIEESDDEVLCENDYFKNVEYDYIWSKNNVDIICTDKDNYNTIIKKNMYFFKSMEVKCNLQETTLINLYRCLGVYKLSNVINLTIEEWEKVDKVGNKKATTIVNSLFETIDWDEIKKKNNSDTIWYNYLIKYFIGLQSFNRGFASKKIILHFEYLIRLTKNVDWFNYKELYNKDYLSKNKDKVINYLSNNDVKFITIDSMNLFLDGLNSFIDDYDNLYKSCKVIHIPSFEELLKNIPNNLLDNNLKKSKNIVFSGVRDKTIEEKYIKDGYVISNVVNKNTELLIVDNLLSISGKINKAKMLGINITEINILKK